MSSLLATGSLCVAALILVSACAVQAAAPESVPFKVPGKLPDVMQLPHPAEVRMEGYLGTRVANNAKARLLVVNEEELLAGFRKRPGKQDWIGEHVGKFLHAATLAWANTGDPELRAKIDRVAAELLKTQEADGYLGTYVPEKHWTSWDVWVHKYCLIGLLTYHQYTGDQAALDGARKAGDLLTNTFGPGKKSIIKAGEHVGMAATSVLEPIVVLYRFTADERYLDFAKYIVAAWDEPGGPKVLKTLTEVKAVNKTANGKAYEMLSNLVGLCELARVTGDKTYLTPALNAWEDVVAHQLYITGSASRGEHFGPDYDLPNGQKANVGETCVTTTWIQLNMQLLRLTGEARFGDELERTYFNHLAGAQRPDGAMWAYYTPLTGTKPYGNSTNCCLSSGPRGMALAPQLTYLTYKADGQDGVAVNLFDTSKFTARLGGQAVTVKQQTGFPLLGSAEFTFHMEQPATFGFKLRAPAWAEPLKLRLEGDANEIAAPRGDWVAMAPRKWKDGDRVAVTFTVAARLVNGEHTNKGAQALLWGPLVLAYDAKRNQGLPPPSGVALATTGESAPAVKPSADLPPAFEVSVRTAADPQPKTATLVPFAEAGRDGGAYQVWLRTADKLGAATGFAAGRESRSREGNMQGSIADGDPESVVVTFDGKKADEDWFAVEADQPVKLGRVVFMHGRCFHDGGWFDASAGKPKVQVQREKGGAWETIGTLDDYPATTAANNGGLKDGQAFTLKLKEPVNAVGLRVVGKPACGDSANQAFSSCAELQAQAE
ncbi:MAG: glycoside hydrolase family 127 protein [Planctomycetota bacterium]|nr:glycoside hydrolase family 127 protein [Planctomycetota bacterium]